MDLKTLFEKHQSLNKSLKNSTQEVKKDLKKNSEKLPDRPYSKESSSGENLEIKWNPKAIACSDNQEINEVILDDLAEINKKLNRKNGSRNT